MNTETVPTRSDNNHRRQTPTYQNREESAPMSLLLRSIEQIKDGNLLRKIKDTAATALARQPSGTTQDSKENSRGSSGNGGSPPPSRKATSKAKTAPLNEGDEVIFGAPKGEKTRGTFMHMTPNGKHLTIKTLEPRGRTGQWPIGTVFHWNIEDVTKVVSETPSPKAAPTPKTTKSTPRTPKGRRRRRRSSQPW